MGFGRNLTAGEILEQLLVLARLLRDEQDARVHNVVMMGMGEPFQNYERVLDACRSMNDPDGFGLGARQIAISTAGWVPGDRQARARAACSSSSRSRSTPRTTSCARSSCRSTGASRSPS